MAYLGLVPCESSTGERVRRGRITKAGDPTVRRVLIEGAWTYRSPAGVSRPLQVRLEGLPAVVRGDRLEGAIAAVRAIADFLATRASSANQISAACRRPRGRIAADAWGSFEKIAIAPAAWA